MRGGWAGRGEGQGDVEGLKGEGCINAVVDKSSQVENGFKEGKER